MRTYEVVYILSPSVERAHAEEKLERLHALATSGGGSVESVDHWGLRRLAYPIKREDSGYYVVAHVRAVPDALPEFERLLRLDEEIMRYLLVINEGESTDGQSKLGEVRLSEEDMSDASLPEDDEDVYDDPDYDGSDAIEDESSAEAGLSEGEDDEGGEVRDEKVEGHGTESDAEEAEEEEEVRSGPPEFFGPGGRRRRAEGPAIKLLDYKDVRMLSYFITDQGKILPKRTTHIPAHLQRKLGRAIKRARYLALIPYTGSFDR